MHLPPSSVVVVVCVSLFSCAAAWQPHLPRLVRPAARGFVRPLQGLQALETPQTERRIVVQRCLSALIGVLAAAPPPTWAASPTVSWPAADAGLPKTALKVVAPPPPVRAAPSPDGRAQLARSEVDLRGISFANLPRGEAGVREGVRLLVASDPKIAASLLRLAFHDAIALDTVCVKNMCTAYFVCIVLRICIVFSICVVLSICV